MDQLVAVPAQGDHIANDVAASVFALDDPMNGRGQAIKAAQLARSLGKERLDRAAVANAGVSFLAHAPVMGATQAECQMPPVTALNGTWSIGSMPNLFQKAGSASRCFGLRMTTEHGMAVNAAPPVHFNECPGAGQASKVGVANTVAAVQTGMPSRLGQGTASPAARGPLGLLATASRTGIGAATCVGPVSHFIDHPEFIVAQVVTALQKEYTSWP